LTQGARQGEGEDRGEDRQVAVTGRRGPAVVDGGQQVAQLVDGQRRDRQQGGAVRSAGQFAHLGLIVGPAVGRG